MKRSATTVTLRTAAVSLFALAATMTAGAAIAQETKNAAVKERQIVVEAAEKAAEAKPAAEAKSEEKPAEAAEDETAKAVEAVKQEIAKTEAPVEAEKPAEAPAVEAPVVEKKVVKTKPFVIVHNGQHYLVRKGADGKYIILGHAKRKKHY